MKDIKVMYEALIFSLPLKGCAKNKCAQNQHARKKDAQNLKLSEN